MAGNGSDTYQACRQVGDRAFVFYYRLPPRQAVSLCIPFPAIAQHLKALLYSWLPLSSPAGTFADMQQTVVGYTTKLPPRSEVGKWRQILKLLPCGYYIRKRLLKFMDETDRSSILSKSPIVWIISSIIEAQTIMLDMIQTIGLLESMELLSVSSMNFNSLFLI